MEKKKCEVGRQSCDIYESAFAGRHGRVAFTPLNGGRLQRHTRWRRIRWSVHGEVFQMGIRVGLNEAGGSGHGDGRSLFQTEARFQPVRTYCRCHTGALRCVFCGSVPLRRTKRPDARGQNIKPLT